MAQKYPTLDDKLTLFIKKQKLFFVGTAAQTGSINVSPKGIDTFRVVSDKKVIWLNLTGSGNETAAHILQNNRMTIMFCSFDSKPLILRLYGQANIYHEGDAMWDQYMQHFDIVDGARQIFELSIELVQTSCGYGVPLFQYEKERETLTKWSKHKGQEGIQEYWQLKNTKSLDGFSTDIEKQD